jgi:hypothetical protein
MGDPEEKPHRLARRTGADRLACNEMSGMTWHRLRELGTWEPSRGKPGVLIAKIDRREAAALADDAEARRALETFLRARHDEAGTHGLLMFVVRDSEAIGFCEVSVAGTEIAWNGPCATLGGPIE